MPTAIERCYLADGGRTGVYPEAASQIFVQNDFVGLDSSGNVIALLSAGSEHTTATSQKILGIVGRNGNNTTASTTPNTPVTIFTNDTQIELSCYSATPANAEQQDVIIGQTYALRNQGGIYCAMLDTTASGTLVCVQKYNGVYAATDQYPRAIFKVVPASLDFGS